MRHIIIFAILATVCLPVAAQALTLEGRLTQGGMVVGKVDPSVGIQFQGKAVRVSPEGLFVIGFPRDAEAEMSIELHQPAGSVITHPIHIEKRTYKIQRIDGLPPRKVRPAAEDLERIRKENALVHEIRKKNDPRTDFTQPFIWPVIGRISGIYGSQRILNGVPRQPHAGVDIAAPTGTPVKAPADGVVSLAYDEMFYSGKTLIIDHGHGLSTSYLHLQKILVKDGQRVKQGEVIARVGATGRVTGPHLHWGMNWFENRLDPSLLVPPMPQAASASANGQ